MASAREASVARTLEEEEGLARLRLNLEKERCVVPPCLPAFLPACGVVWSWGVVHALGSLSLSLSLIDCLSD